MKFNFEKVKDNAKKIIMGASVITASIGNLEAQEVKPNQTEKEINKTEVFNNTLNDKTKEDTIQERIISDQQKIKNIEKDLGISKENSINDPEYYRTEYLKYMEHPSYKERLSKEMYGDALIDEEMKKNIDEEYKERLERIKSVSIQMDEKFIPSSKENGPEYYEKTHNIETNMESIFHELSHSAEGGISNVGKGFERIRRSFKNQGELVGEKKRLETERSKVLNEIMPEDVYEKNHQEFIDLLKKHINDNINNTEFKTNNLTKKLENIYEIREIGVNDFLNSFNLKESKPKFKVNFSKDKQSFGIEEDLFNLKESIPIIQSNFINKNNELLKKLISYESVQNYYSKKIGPIVSYLLYLNRGSEIKARLNHLRMSAIENYNFDLNNDFNINDFKELKNDSQYNDLKKNLGLSDKQINELMKYTADNGKNTKNKEYFNTEWNYNGENNKA